MEIPSEPEITNRAARLWLLLPLTISYVDVQSAHIIWYCLGRPDFYFRSGDVLTLALLAFFGTLWWMIVLWIVFALLSKFRLSSGCLSFWRFAAIVVLVSAVFTGFHLYEFHVHRLIRNGFCSGIVALSIVLVESANKIWKIRRPKHQTQPPLPEPAAP